MEKKYAIGIDLGGTSVKYALIDNEGSFHFHGRLPSRADVSSEAIIAQLRKAAGEAKSVASVHRLKVEGIGIGTPGIVDGAGRIVLGGAENLAGWEDIPLARLMEEFAGVPVRLGNDANLMGLGEMMFGAGRGFTDIVFITVGTGIGGAVLIGGKLFSGFGNRGTELGHVPLIADGEKCACGSTGCLEHYASASALVRRFRHRAEKAGWSFTSQEVNGELIVGLYEENDPLAIACMDEHCDFLGHGIGGFINIFSPQLVIVGGGLPESGEFYIRKVSESAFRYAMPGCAVNTRVVAAALGNRAGCMGAASLFF